MMGASMKTLDHRHERRRMREELKSILIGLAAGLAISAFLLLHAFVGDSQRDDLQRDLENAQRVCASAWIEYKTDAPAEVVGLGCR